MNHLSRNRFFAVFLGILGFLPLTVYAINTTPGTYSATAFNETANVNATARDAQAGEVLQIHLLYNNTSGYQQTPTLQADLQDLLYLADIIDLGGASLSGALLTFPSTTVGNGASIDRSFRVQVKAISPTTVDRMINIPFGTGVDIRVQPGGVVKGTYVSPSTGPKENLALAFVLAGLVTLLWSAKHLPIQPRAPRA
ncbi:MAG: hypothetical protein A2722_01210 [Candidatus Doudnabacteria bacterium RIFCSPHIGHO2_01_FULL_50_11]|uniref:Uncharacterized protein n=1 Tax=Candidatus Doudnabacteria bacterium RIFCSPHIGHO2_01_FULL_50_11 TaxID=1817828 RepID=A0A1F5PEX0_9BACT|nr:MAG: hypothetical protein A2722_01210 [Candidatus Doudnabacteria bacterium RIFCSPHIGHO2_01_FULL_50_11]